MDHISKHFPARVAMLPVIAMTWAIFGDKLFKHSFCILQSMLMEGNTCWFEDIKDFVFYITTFRVMQLSATAKGKTNKRGTVECFVFFDQVCVTPAHRHHKPSPSENRNLHKSCQNNVSFQGTGCEGLMENLGFHTACPRNQMKRHFIKLSHRKLQTEC